MWLYSDIKTLGDIPRHYARTTPQQTALVDGAGQVSYSTLDKLTNQIARAVIGEAIPLKSHIGYLGKNSSRYFEALFGVNKAGCALAPLNWRLAAPELALVIADAQCPLVFADIEFEANIKTVQALCTHPFRIVLLDPTRQASTEFDAWVAAQPSSDPHIEVEPWQTALLIYTSGTTGKPKGVQLSHQGLSYMRCQ